MNRRERAHAQFDESADMRLLELQRAALGVAPPPRPNWESRISTDGTSVNPEIVAAPASAVLNAELSAVPREDVIPGAVVTLALSLANEGAAAARDTLVAVPLPAGAAYRSGSFELDGRPQPDERAERLFGEGLHIAHIAPGTRTTLLWKIGVRFGVEPLVIAPFLQGRASAILGAAAIAIGRKPGAQSAFAGEVERLDRVLHDPLEEELLPVYELDSEEQIVHEAVDAALQSRYEPPLSPVPSPEPPPAVPEPPVPPTQPEPLLPPAQPEPGPPPEQPDPGPQEPPVYEPAAAAPLREALALVTILDRPTMAFFQRLFTGAKPPTLLDHFTFAGALACTRSYADGSEIAGLKAHLDAQAQLLHRVKVHARLGRKEPITEYAGSLLARLEDLAPGATPAQPGVEPAGGSLLLETEVSPPLLAVVRKISGERERWDFVKARQLTLALQAQRVRAPAVPALLENAQAALRSYAQLSMTQLQRFFVRIRVDRTTGLLFQADPELDTAARRLLAAFARLANTAQETEASPL